MPKPISVASRQQKSRFINTVNLNSESNINLLTNADVIETAIYVNTSIQPLSNADADTIQIKTTMIVNNNIQPLEI